MKKNNSKIEILLDSFNVLKENVKVNEDKLGSIIDICLLEDKNLAVEIWEHLIDSNIKLIKAGKLSKITDHLLFLIFYDPKQHISENEMCDLVYNSEKIRHAMFKYSESQGLTCRVIAYFICNNELEKADNIFCCLKSNTNMDITIAKVMEGVMNYLPEANDNSEKPISKAAVELITNWISAISDKTERARVNVSFLNKVPSL